MVSDVCCPAWLLDRLRQSGGEVPFSLFMHWALHDPDHGAYGSGRLAVGPEGDFTTSPSLGEDFAELLVDQLVEWLQALAEFHPDDRLSVVDVGPGEGTLTAQLIPLLLSKAPGLVDRLDCVLVECNPGMELRQKQRLGASPAIPCRWSSLEDLRLNPLVGVVVAHELLDALSVERLVLRSDTLNRQMVRLRDEGSSAQIHLAEGPFDGELRARFQSECDRSGMVIPPVGAEDGWTTEWHASVAPWMRDAAAAVKQGVLLVVDYAFEADRYYTCHRSDGTLLAYQQQVATNDVLRNAGTQDITAHLCVDGVVAAAEMHGWMFEGQRRQGEALLALGLAERFSALQSLPAAQLGEALRRRETLLRLVDPSCLGDLRWMVFHRQNERPENALGQLSRLLRDPQQVSAGPLDTA